MSHCFSTVARPSMSQLRSNAEKAPQEQHEDCMTKYNEIQLDTRCVQHISGPTTRSRMSSTVKVGSDLSLTVQEDTEVIHRSRRRNEDPWLPEGEPVRSLGNTSTDGFGEENTWNSMQEGSRVTPCVTLNTPARLCPQTKLTTE